MHATSTEVRVKTAVEAQTAVAQLQSNQTIVFDVDTMQLTELLVIKGVSDVTIRGVRPSTTLLCPAKGSIFSIRCSISDAACRHTDSRFLVRRNCRNLRIESLVFRGCNGAFSAIEVLGSERRSRTALLDDSDEDWQSTGTNSDWKHHQSSWRC